MEIGYPDWFGQPIFPRYGGGLRASFLDDAVAGTRIDLATITGQGMIYGAGLGSNGVGVQHDDRIYVNIDGVDVFYGDFLNIFAFGNVPGVPRQVIVTRYDNVNYRYHLVIGYGITFETSLKVSYEEKHDRTPGLNFAMEYALIE